MQIDLFPDEPTSGGNRLEEYVEMFWSGQRIYDEVLKVVGANKSKLKWVKINPNGVDIGVSSVERIENDAVATIDGERRELNAPMTSCKPQNGMYILGPGVYVVRLNVAVRMPSKAIGLSMPRSTLIRLGVVKCETAVFDPGYEGIGAQTIYIPISQLRIAENERWFQFIVADAMETGMTYTGRYQGEGIQKKRKSKQ
jgi:deoxycytidine triphosphate deaminase